MRILPRVVSDRESRYNLDTRKVAPFSTVFPKKSRRSPSQPLHSEACRPVKVRMQILRAMRTPREESRGLQTGLAHHPCRRPERQPLADSRHGRRQRALPELRGAGRSFDRAGQAVLDDGLSQPHAQHQRGRRHARASVRADETLSRAEPVAGAQRVTEPSTWEAFSRVVTIVSQPLPPERLSEARGESRRPRR